MTQTTPNFAALTHNGGSDVAPVPINRILADVEQAAYQLEPAMHIALLYDILCALQRGGVDVRAHIDCVLYEMD